MKRNRTFNTSGPNIPEEHYTIMREDLIKKGIDLVQRQRYFTIWAPRQTGKSTFFRLLAKKLNTMDYKAVYFSTEGFTNFSITAILKELNRSILEQIDQKVCLNSLEDFIDFFRENRGDPFVLIIDEIEGLNPELLSQFLHSIRNLYHTRDKHCLKSVILVGVSNILGVIEDNASPFNIADNLDVPYFTKAEVYELLGQHEKETGQLFDTNVKDKIATITACQPGLVNGFAYQLTTRFQEKKLIDYEDYLIVEDWYLKKTIDKNIANVISKASRYRSFVESLLFTEKKIEYDIDRPAIKYLHTQGIITSDTEGFVRFWVPIYRKKLFKAFYPYSNGESDFQLREINLGGFFLEKGKLNFDKLLKGYRTYIKRRGFRYFREKDEQGNFKHTKEAAMVYSFESFIQLLLQVLEGKSYLESHTGLGQTDLLINIDGRETVIEFKIYRDKTIFEKGKKQLAYYCRSVSITEGIYLVFVPKCYQNLGLEETEETIDDVFIKSYLVYYDEEKDF
ncbi:MAG: ATP-binding protein [bacterium]